MPHIPTRAPYCRFTAEDNRRIQMIEPNAGTFSRIAQAEQYLQ